MSSAGARLLPWFRVLSARDADALAVAAEPATDDRAGALAVTTTASPGHHSRCPPPPRLFLGSASDASAGVSRISLFPSRTLAALTGGNDDTESKGGTLGEEDYDGGRLYRVRRRRRRPRWQRRRHVVWDDNGEEDVGGDVDGDGNGDGGRGRVASNVSSNANVSTKGDKVLLEELLGQLLGGGRGGTGGPGGGRQ